MTGSRGFLVPCFVVAGITAVIAAVVGLLTAGIDGATGAPVGVALAALGFASSVWAVTRAEKIDIRLTMPVALLTYVVKLVAFGIALWAVDSSGWDALTPMALGIGAGAIAWLCTQGIWLYRAKTPYVELDERH